MDPMKVLRMLWHYKVVFLPVLLVTLSAAVYVFQFGPRYYQSTVSYALVNPKLPSEKELDSNPQLSALNSDNPFLRSSDPALITEVLVARLSSNDMSTTLKNGGLSTDYSVVRGVNGNGFVVAISAISNSVESATATTKTLGRAFEDNLRSMQKVNGADDKFLFTSFVVNPGDKALEQFSSRLRSSIMVLLGGVVLMFGAVSLARSLENRRGRRRSDTEPDSAAPDDSFPSRVPGIASTVTPPHSAGIPADDQNPAELQVPRVRERTRKLRSMEEDRVH